MQHIERRSFLGLALSAVPMTIGADLTTPGPGATVYVRAGTDRFGVHKTLGISTIDFKVTGEDSSGAMLVIENTNRAKGGPARHLHVDQDELFYVTQGHYVIEIGSERYDLSPGDTILAPRQVPHAWAFVGDVAEGAVGRLLITFTPPGQMEAFFREVSRTDAMPVQDPRLWRQHGMELLGPPLEV